jgi:hypothetical protein
MQAQGDSSLNKRAENKATIASATKGAYLSARYESRREIDDFSVLNYLQGKTELNPVEEAEGKQTDKSSLERVAAVTTASAHYRSHRHGQRNQEGGEYQEGRAYKGQIKYMHYIEYVWPGRLYTEILRLYGFHYEAN